MTLFRQISRHPTLPLVTPWAFWLCLLMSVGGCTRNSERSSMAEEMQTMPDQESWNAELRISSNGRPKLLMRAAYIARYDNRDSTYAILGADPMGGDSTPVHVELFDEQGRLSVTLSATELTYFDLQKRFDGEGSVEAVLLRAGGVRLTADRLIYEEGDGRFVASGNVLVVSGDGKRLTTEEVIWNAAAKQFRASGSFHFTTLSERISGVGLVASEDLASYSFSRASGELEVEE